MTSAEKQLNDILDAYDDMVGWQKTVSASNGDSAVCDEADRAERFFYALLHITSERRRGSGSLPAAFIDVIDDLPLD